MSNLIARFSFIEPVPGRLYLSDCGLEQLFRGSDPIDEARRYAQVLIGGFDSSDLRPNCLLGIIWGDMVLNAQSLDLFGFSGIAGWPGNPEVYA